MLFLVIHLGADRYALDVTEIEEVLPVVQMAQVPGAPPEVAGIFNYRGAPVPAIDLSQLTLGRPARNCFSTRIVVVRLVDERGVVRLLGVIAERATKTVRLAADSFKDAAVSCANALHQGSVIMDAEGMIQRAHFERLLPPSVRSQFFAQSAVAS